MSAAETTETPTARETSSMVAAKGAILALERLDLRLRRVPYRKVHGVESLSRRDVRDLVTVSLADIRGFLERETRAANEKPKEATP